VERFDHDEGQLEPHCFRSAIIYLGRLSHVAPIWSSGMSVVPLLEFRRTR
jgi:hypothetical protein